MKAHPKSERKLVRLVGLFKRLVDPDAGEGFQLGGYVDSLTSTPYSLGNACLRAYCEADPTLAQRYQFDTVSVVDLSGTGHLDPVEEVRLRKQDVVSLLEGAPAAIGFSCYAWNVEAALAACAAIKQSSPSTFTVLGGRAVESVGASLVTRFPFVDFVINGEGELPFAALLRSGFDKQAPQPGLTFMGSDGQLKHQAPDLPVMDLDSLPSPFQTGIIPASPDGLLMELSRGCVHDCGYCAWNSCKVRRRFSRKRITAELAWAVAHGARHITFIDSAINYETDLLDDLLGALAEADPQGRLEFTYNLRHEELCEEQFRHLRRLPSRQILLGMETLSDPAMEASHRTPFDTQRFSETVRELAKVAPPVIGVVLGLPDDTLAGFQRTMEYLGQLSGTQEPHSPRQVGAVLVSLLQVFPSTRLHAQAEAYGMNIRPRGIPYVLGHTSFPLSHLKEALRFLQLFRLRYPGLVKGPEGQASILGPDGSDLFAETVRRLLLPWAEGATLEGWQWASTIAYLDGDGFGAFLFSHPRLGKVTIRLDGRNSTKPCYTHTQRFNIYFSGSNGDTGEVEPLIRTVARAVEVNEAGLP